MKKLIPVVAGLLINNKSEVLLTQRPLNKVYGGFWEFPGGKIEDGETPEEALARELMEEIGIHIDPHAITPFQFISHSYETFHVLLLVFECREWTGEVTLKEGQEGYVWSSLEFLESYPLPEADLVLLPRLKEALGMTYAKNLPDL